MNTDKKMQEHAQRCPTYSAAPATDDTTEPMGYSLGKGLICGFTPQWLAFHYHLPRG